MAGVCKSQGLAAGLTLRGFVRSPDGTQIADQVAEGFVAFDADDWANYKITVSDPTGLGHYQFTFPAWITDPGNYPFGFVDHGTNAIKAEGFYDWDGTSEITLAGGVLLAAGEDVYHFKLTLSRSGQYTVRFLKNNVLLAGGEITSPTITVRKRSDGSLLIDAEPLEQIGSTGVFKYDAADDEQLSVGDTALVTCTATVDGATRTFYEQRLREL